MLSSYRDLKEWRKSVHLAVSIYRLTGRFPKEETYGIAAQMRRSAVSIPSNIAESHGRFGQREYRQFLGVARGSNFELQTQLEIASELGFGDAREIEDAKALSHEVGKMIYAISEKLLHPIPATPSGSASVIPEP